jgi:uncharacterized protein (DUF2141 family)
MWQHRFSFLYIFCFLSFILISLLQVSCANIGTPTGGPRDSLAPTLRNASPSLRSVNSTANKITLVFDEYVEVVDAQNNVIVSPYQTKNPIINYNLNTVTVRLRDSLIPNTTYSINFGDAIKDVNEGNVFRDFIYTFSTGPTIDSLSISGKVIVANTGLIDSTLQVYLYQDAVDTAVLFQKPKYITRLNSKGEFSFMSLPAANFRIFALKDTDGSKNYNSAKEVFGFYPDNATVSTLEDSVKPFTLYAYAEEETNSPTQTTTGGVKTNEKERTNYLRIGAPPAKRQDIYSAATVSFTGRLKTPSLVGIMVTDTNYNRIRNVVLQQDSVGNNINILHNWAKGQPYYLLLDKDIIEEEGGKKLFKSDTLSFTAMDNADYGRLAVEFKNYDASQKVRLQIIKDEKLVVDTLIAASSWKYDRLTPGGYSLRLLYDTNGNGKWDTGDFRALRQPEKVLALPNKLTIRGDWDNEITIEL